MVSSKGQVVLKYSFWIGITAFLIFNLSYYLYRAYHGGGYLESYPRPFKFVQIWSYNIVVIVGSVQLYRTLVKTFYLSVLNKMMLGLVASILISIVYNIVNTSLVFFFTNYDVTNFDWSKGGVDILVNATIFIVVSFFIKNRISAPE